MSNKSSVQFARGGLAGFSHQLDEDDPRSGGRKFWLAGMGSPSPYPTPVPLRLRRLHPRA